MNKFAKDISISVLGCIIAAFGTSCFLLPNKLSTGGFSGIATILYYFFEFNMGTTIIILNIPLFIFAYFRLGKYFVTKTVISTMVFSYFIDVFENMGGLVNDKFLGSIYGGILMGIGLALIFKVETSTGGTDLIANLVQSFNSNIKIGRVLEITDLIVVLLNLIFFRDLEIGLYSFIAIYLYGRMLDLFFEGINFSKMIYIISDKYEEISKAINLDFKSGATGFFGKGLYTGTDKLIIMCVTKRKNIIKIKEIAKKIDKNVFMIVTDAREVYGLGFKK